MARPGRGMGCCRPLHGRCRPLLLLPLPPQPVRGGTQEAEPGNYGVSFAMDATMGTSRRRSSAGSQEACRGQWA